jgi:DNA-binding HxlR family transcriptional regulator
VRPYAQYCPIAKAAEVLGDRWSLLIVREMVSGSHRFNELARGLPGLSRALLSKRLQQLQRVGVVAHSAQGYELTRAGEELKPLIFGLAEWGAKWAFAEPMPEELDPDLLLWWIHRGIDPDKRPDKRVVIEFEFSDHDHRFWLVVEPEDVSVCVTPPGIETDVLVSSTLPTMYRVWLGREELYDAMRDDRVRLSGTPSMVRALPRWLEFSPVAGYVREARDLIPTQ